MNSILENIDTIRRNKGYSQEYLAMQIGMKQAGFSLIMSGERELKYNTLLQIANALQMSVIDVLHFPINTLWRKVMEHRPKLFCK